MMSNDLVIYLSKQLLWQALLISSPIIVVTLICGLVISIIQVVTQIQDSHLESVTITTYLQTPTLITSD